MFDQVTVIFMHWCLKASISNLKGTDRPRFTPTQKRLQIFSIVDVNQYVFVSKANNKCLCHRNSSKVLMVISIRQRETNFSAVSKHFVKLIFMSCPTVSRMRANPLRNLFLSLKNSYFYTLPNEKILDPFENVLRTQTACWPVQMKRAWLLSLVMTVSPEFSCRSVAVVDLRYCFRANTK